MTRHDRTLLAWQLALLRFAVTLDDNDRLAVLAAATEIDRPSRIGGHESDFRFFRRTSAELCMSISDPGQHGLQGLHQYLTQIDHARLKRSFAAAVLHRLPDEKALIGGTRERNDDLWRGLSPRLSSPRPKA